MTAPLGIAVAQFAPTADRTANLQAIAGLVATTAERGARVVLLPEYSSFFVDPFDASLAAHAEPVDGPFTAALRELAAAHDLVVVAGLLERAGEAAPGGHARVRNTVVAVGPDGVRAVYRKLHLYDAFGQRESDWVEPGALVAPETFEVDGVRFALMTCYDLRFPEVARTLADTGAHVVLVAAEWVRGPLKEHHWNTLLAARAIENTVYVVAADHPGPIGVGLSQVVDPQGVVTAQVGSGEGIAVTSVERATVDRVRETNPSLRMRRYAVVPR